LHPRFFLHQAVISSFSPLETNACGTASDYKTCLRSEFLPMFIKEKEACVIPTST
jgi:hypothetical protein